MDVLQVGMGWLPWHGGGEKPTDQNGITDARDRLLDEFGEVVDACDPDAGR